MVIVLIIILPIFFILAVNSSSSPKKATAQVTRKEIEVNLKDYQNEYIFSVAGVHLSHYSYAVYNYCKVHDLVTLIPEPENRYDSDAIMVKVSGWEIGYVPAEETIDVHRILSKEHICYVESKNLDSYISVYIKIRYKD